MRVRAAVVVAACAFAVGQVHLLGDLAPLITGLLITGAIAVLVRWHRRRARAATPDAASLTGPLSVCWLVTTLLPVHSFSARSSSEAATTISLQPALELLVFLVVGLVAAGAIRMLEPTTDSARPPALLFVLPIWIIASSAWTATGPYAFVRGSQMLMVAVLAWATTALGRADRAQLEALLGIVLRWFVRSVLVLVALGVAFGDVYSSSEGSNAARFTWVGAHPNGSGLAISFGILILFVAPRPVLRLRPPLVVASLGVLGWAMYANHSRAAWLCLLAGLLVAFTLQGRLNPMVRWAGTPLLAAGAIGATELWGEAIWEYILRDRSVEELATGNGRRELWAIGLRSLDTAFDWLCGLGYGVTRTLFLEEAPWAGEAHNSILALLVSVGLVGVATLAAVLAQTVRNVLRARLWARSSLGVAATALLVLVIVNGMSNDVMAEPTIGFVVLNLVAAFAAVEGWGPTGAGGRGGEPTSRRRTHERTDEIDDGRPRTNGTASLAGRSFRGAAP